MKIFIGCTVKNGYNVFSKDLLATYKNHNCTIRTDNILNEKQLLNICCNIRFADTTQQSNKKSSSLQALQHWMACRTAEFISSQCKHSWNFHYVILAVNVKLALFLIWSCADRHQQIYENRAVKTKFLYGENDHYFSDSVNRVLLES